VHQIIRHSFHVILLCGLLVGCSADDGDDSPPPQSGVGTPITNPDDGTTSPVTYYESVGCSGTSVYVLAHQHDWQLFMNPKAYKDIQAATCTTAFIFLSAGDAGHGVTDDYYKARNNATISVTRVVYDHANKAGPWTPSTSPVITPSGEIAHHQYEGTHSYFFSLPDGGESGEGFQETGSASLKKLYEGDSITPIDNPAIKYTWSELVFTLHEIVAMLPTGGPLYINSFDTSLRNATDHPDRYYAGKAAEDLVNGYFPDAGYRVFLGSGAGTLQRNLAVSEAELKKLVYAWTVGSVAGSGYPVVWNSSHLDKTYSCIAQAATPAPINSINEPHCP